MKYFDFDEIAKEIAKQSDDTTAIVSGRNKVIDQEFPKAVKKAGFQLLKPGTAFDLSNVPEATVVGVELWSNLDLCGFYSLANRISAKNLSVFVFDIDEWSNAGELDRVISGICPRRTPVFIRYRYGQMVEALEGPDALARMNQID